MNKMLIILWYEIYTLISRKSFWFGALGVPAIAFLIYAGIAWMNNSQGGSTSPTAAIEEIFTRPEDPRPQGFVDLSGLIREFPQDYPGLGIIGYTNLNDAKTDLDNGQISAYFVVAENYLETGLIDVYTPDFDLISSQDRIGSLIQLINFNLLSGDTKIQGAIENPLAGLQEENLSPNLTPTRDPDDVMTFFLPYAVMMLFYVSILGSSGLLLNSMTKEKENRVLEILMVSTNARELLLGKMLGLGLVGLLQVLIWGLSSYSLLQLSGNTFQISDEFLLNPSILGWGLVYFILGYLVYAALMAGIGAMVPGLREASQATTIIVIPMMIPLFLISALIDKPNSVFTTILSIFPFTAPTTMMLRLSASPDVPLWQILLSILLLIITAYLTIRAVAGIFRAHTMLSGQPFKIKRFIWALVGKG